MEVCANQRWSVKSKEIPFVIAPALLILLTGGWSAPSRCHGVLLCNSFACPIFLSSEPSCLTSRLSTAAASCLRTLLFEKPWNCTRFGVAFLYICCVRFRNAHGLVLNVLTTCLSAHGNEVFGKIRNMGSIVEGMMMNLPEPTVRSQF
jgi:hypothetical protein